MGWVKGIPQGIEQLATISNNLQSHPTNSSGDGLLSIPFHNHGQLLMTSSCYCQQLLLTANN